MKMTIKEADSYWKKIRNNAEAIDFIKRSSNISSEDRKVLEETVDILIVYADLIKEKMAKVEFEL